jgi:large subunit ribosomal protein L1
LYKALQDQWEYKQKTNMGKIRVRTLGDESAEEQLKKEAKQKKEIKKAEQIAKAENKADVMAEAVESSPAKVTEEQEKELEAETEAKSRPEPKKQKKDKFKKEEKKNSRSAKYLEAKALVEETKTYPLSDALVILQKMQTGKFDQTIELHLNTNSQGLSGQVVLPHGSGKQTRVVIATDQIIADVEKGKIEFDILVADPSMMPKLAKVAKVLGPRGLMPNPKSGTITTKPEEVVKKYQGGQITFRTEGKAPIMHLIVGKASFGEKKLEENIKTVLSAIKKENINKAVLKSTMSPGIKIAL